jgi:hypothetical protein
MFTFSFYSTVYIVLYQVHFSILKLIGMQNSKVNSVQNVIIFQKANTKLSVG